MAVVLPDGEDLNEWLAVNSECIRSLLLLEAETGRVQMCFHLASVQRGLGSSRFRHNAMPSTRLTSEH